MSLKSRLICDRLGGGEGRTMKALRSIGLTSIWAGFACAGLLLLQQPALAQAPQDPGDQPGIEADESYELPPEFQKQMVFYRTAELPGTIIVETSERHLYLVQPGG